jgi:hypothetical protein
MCEETSSDRRDLIGMEDVVAISVNNGCFANARSAEHDDLQINIVGHSRRTLVNVRGRTFRSEKVAAFESDDWPCNQWATKEKEEIAQTQEMRSERWINNKEIARFGKLPQSQSESLEDIRNRRDAVKIRQTQNSTHVCITSTRRNLD